MIQEPVVVVGAGPVGLTAALRMGMLGLDVVLFEKRSQPNRFSKAGCFHPPTLQIFDDFGIAEEMIRVGQKVDFIQYRATDDSELALFDCAELASETVYPFRIHLEQASVVAMLLEKAANFPSISVHFDTEVTAIANEQDHAVVTTRSNGEVRLHKSSFVFVADGANSTLRAALGVDFEGEIYPERVLRVRTPMDLDTILPGIRPLTYIFNGSRSLAFLKMPDCWRIVTRAERGIPDEIALSPKYYESRLEPFLGSRAERIENALPDVFQIGKCVASSYAAGRSFLMGDAAHISSTRGGMNMNCGVHDANAFAYAAADALASGSLSPLMACAESRRAVARDYLLGRADTAVARGAEWLAYIQNCARDPAERRAFLRSNLMLDML